VVTSSEHDLTDDEVILHLMFGQIDQTMPNPRELTNANMALERLCNMRLPGINERPEDVTWEDWLGGKESELAKMVKAKWGTYAVLNVDLGLGPDNRPLEASGRRVDRLGTTAPIRPDRRPGNTATGTSDDGNPESAARTTRRWPPAPLLAALVLLAAAIGWWIAKARAAGH
jgi:hypothetical protein